MQITGVGNGGVSISGAYQDRCAKKPDMAKTLEENLAAYSDCVQRGYQSAKNAAQARLSQAPQEAGEDLGISAFDLAGLL